MTGRENIGTFQPETLIADTSVPVDVVTVTLEKTDSIKKLERGTVLAADITTGKCTAIKAVSNSTSYAAYILAEETYTSAIGETVGQAYQTGKFVSQGLKTANGYELTQNDLKSLRDSGIFVEHAMM